ncbi:MULTISPECIES: FimD/PapC N-terminal domain-containing protein [unclassified Pseudomonas]|uniref:FimD/PapC N-terminal domain-containing protein n=1 Tax=unclassified Pseudomonas TaxID=196821 RepID=UPI0030DC0646
MRTHAPNLDCLSVPFTPLRLSVAILAALVPGWVHANEPAKFDSSFMQSFGGTHAGPNLDLDAVANSGSIGPGTYPVVVRLNQSFFDRRDITFVKDEQSAQVRACLTAGFLTELGVKLDAFQTPGKALSDCIDLAALIEGASVSFDANRLALDISVPQIALRRDAAGYVAPQEWDRGITAGMLNYQLSAAQTQSDARGNSNQYNLYGNGGFNLGEWRFRSRPSFRQDQDGERDWQRSNTYAQRDLTGIKGTLTLGESFTPGDVFDSIPFAQASLAYGLPFDLTLYGGLLGADFYRAGVAPLKARYIQTAEGATPTPGSANGYASFSVTYR